LPVGFGGVVGDIDDAPTGYSMPESHSKIDTEELLLMMDSHGGVLVCEVAVERFASWSLERVENPVVSTVLVAGSTKAGSVGLQRIAAAWTVAGLHIGIDRSFSDHTRPT
jgi:hypothetical protein